MHTSFGIGVGKEDGKRDSPTLALFKCLMVGGCDERYTTFQNYYYKFLPYWIPRCNQVERPHTYTLVAASFELTSGHHLALNLQVE